MSSKSSSKNNSNRGGGSGRGGGRTGGRQTGGRGSSGRGQQQQSQSRQQNYSTVNKSNGNSSHYTKSWNRLNNFFYLHTNNNYSFIVSRVPISQQKQQQQQQFEHQNYSISSNTDSTNTNTNTKTDPNNILHHVLAESLLDTTTTTKTKTNTTDTTELKYTFYGCDEPVAWDSVRIVKYLSSLNLSHTTNSNDNESQVDTVEHVRCPICLDTYKCARITKCGHVYCLHCWIRYLFYTTPSSSSAPMIPLSTISKSSKATSSKVSTSKVTTSKVTTSTSYKSSKNSYLFYAAKCPCCTQLVHFNDLKPIRFVTIGTIPTNITTTTATSTAASSTTTGSNTTNTTTTITSSKKHIMKFIKLHRKKNCSAPYIPLYNQPMYCHPSSIPSDSTISSTSSNNSTIIDTSYKYCRFNYIDYDNYLQLLNDNIVEIQQHRLLELKTLPYDDYHNNIVIYLNITIDIIQREINNYITNEMYNDQSIRQYYEKTESGMYQKQFQMTMLSSTTTTNNNISNNANQYSGTMYIQDEENEMLFYQSEDGTLCFLSPFNIKCLKEEFSTLAPVQSLDGSTSSSSTLGRGPLPDIIEGRVIDVETIQLTSNIRERYRFLSHIPIHTTIVLIELDINHMLSTKTMYTLRSEFDKRKQYRISRINKEKRSIQNQHRQEQQQEQRIKNDASNFNTYFQSTIPDTSTSTGTTSTSTTIYSNAFYNFIDEDDDLIHILPYLT